MASQVFPTVSYMEAYLSSCLVLKFIGEARCTYAGGIKYVGTMLNGEFHGKGRLSFGKRGGYYEGEYKLGRQVTTLSGAAATGVSGRTKRAPL